MPFLFTCREDAELGNRHVECIPAHSIHKILAPVASSSCQQIEKVKQKVLEGRFLSKLKLCHLNSSTIQLCACSIIV